MNNLILLISILIVSPVFADSTIGKAKWYKACESSKHPFIVSARKRLDTIRQKIAQLKSVSPKYKQLQLVEQKLFEAMFDSSTTNIEKMDLKAQSQKAYKNWLLETSSLSNQLQKAKAEFYEKACKSDHDPHVTKARKRYENICWDCLHPLKKSSK
ncbi:MAG: hypothetical protein OXJ52_07225 [Oligoflexia bacterium]|nr:hypothetical protein [Oligoflexia bacterium]